MALGANGRLEAEEARLPTGRTHHLVDALACEQKDGLGVVEHPRGPLSRVQCRRRVEHGLEVLKERDTVQRHKEVEQLAQRLQIVRQRLCALAGFVPKWVQLHANDRVERLEERILDCEGGDVNRGAVERAQLLQARVDRLQQGALQLRGALG